MVFHLLEEENSLPPKRKILLGSLVIELAGVRFPSEHRMARKKSKAVAMILVCRSIFELLRQKTSKPAAIGLFIWPRLLVVRKPASHAGNLGSNPNRVTTLP